MCENFVVAFVESVDFRQSEVSSQKIGQGALLEPLTVQAPLSLRGLKNVRTEWTLVTFAYNLKRPTPQSSHHRVRSPS